MTRREGVADPSDPYAPGEEFARSPYHDEVARLLETLNFYLPTYRERLGAETHRLVRGNLRVLTECFESGPLNPEAVEIIYEHLLTLSRMLTFKLN